MKAQKIIFVILIPILTLGISSAEIYKWVDENGVTHYSDSPAQNIPEPTETENDETQEAAVAVKTPSVEIYETSWCGYCKKAKNFFRSRGIDFSAYDIEKDQQAARRMMTMTDKRAVPFVVINGQGISGYSVAAYEQALQK